MSLGFPIEAYISQSNKSVDDMPIEFGLTLAIM